MVSNKQAMGWLLAAGVIMTLNTRASAQHTTSSPATDSSVQSSPVQATPKAHVDDAASESSPEIGPAEKRAGWIAPGTEVHAVLARAIDSGSLKNGEDIHARLAAPVKTSLGTLPAGTPVIVNVIGTAPAGKLTAAGEFSLELTRVGSIATQSDIKTFRGEVGKREVADATPALGTNAGLAAGASVSFHIPKPPTPAADAPNGKGYIPGSVNAVASGSPGSAKDASNSGEPTYGNAKSVLAPAQATPAGANQSAAPSGEKQNGTVQPH